MQRVAVFIEVHGLEEREGSTAGVEPYISCGVVPGDFGGAGVELGDLGVGRWGWRLLVVLEA